MRGVRGGRRRRRKWQQRPAGEQQRHPGRPQPGVEPKVLGPRDLVKAGRYLRQGVGRGDPTVYPWPVVGGECTLAGRPPAT